MPTLKINGTSVTVDNGVTVLEAAAQIGVEIPHFCYHPALSRPANCRMCLVEVEKAPKLQPACYTTVGEGMVVQTESDKVIRARRAVLEFILVNHPIDCPVCDQAGECKLQDHYFEYSAQQSRKNMRAVGKVKVFPMGPDVVYDGERCILCTRCVRFCEQVTKTSELTTYSRADMTEIRTFPGQELDNDYSQCVVDLCPVGALTSRQFRFKARVWYLTTTPSICTGCSKGCNVHLEHFRDEVQRYRPRVNPEVNAWWMCDHGRHTVPTLHQDRLLACELKDGASTTAIAGLAAAVAKLRAFVDAYGANKLGIAISPQLACEDALALFEFGRLVGAERYYLTGKPDNAFTLRRSPEAVADDFLIQADKNPNRAGVLRLAEASGVSLAAAGDLIQDLRSGAIRGIYVVGGDMPFDTEQSRQLVAGLDRAEIVVYQGAHRGLVHTHADASLPACTHAEREGTFINADGIRQSFEMAFAPHGLSKPDWQWIEKLAKRMRLTWSYGSWQELQAATTLRLAAPAATDAQGSRSREERSAPQA